MTGDSCGGANAPTASLVFILDAELGKSEARKVNHFSVPLPHEQMV